MFGCLTSFTAMQVIVCFFDIVLSTHNRLHFHEVIIHCHGGSSRRVFALLCGDVVMCAPSAHHTMCALVSERCVCCCVLFSFLRSRFVSWTCPHTPLWRRRLFFRRQFCLLHLTFRLVLLQLHSILFPQCLRILFFCSFTSYTMPPALQACRKRFDHFLSLPVEN